MGGAHNEERSGNTMKVNFQWKFMPRVNTTGSMLADIMDTSKKKQHKCGSMLFTVKYIIFIPYKGVWGKAW